MDISAELCFCTKDDPIHKVEIPYLLTYSLEGVTKSNLTFEAADNIPVLDLRKHPLTYEEHGIQLEPIESKMTYDDWQDSQKIEKVFLKETRDNIRKVVGHQEVYIFEYRVRRRPKSFPYFNGQVIDPNAPVPVLGAHIDYCESDSVARIEAIFKERAPEFLARSYQFLNLWKPLRGPVRDCPLALCDPNSVDFQDDTILVQSVNTTSVGEFLSLHYNPSQRWYYASEQMPWEALVFLGYDSRWPKTPGVPHAAFVQDQSVPDDQARESIEIRAVAFLNGDANGFKALHEWEHTAGLLKRFDRIKSPVTQSTRETYERMVSIAEIRNGCAL